MGFPNHESSLATSTVPSAGLEWRTNQTPLCCLSVQEAFMEASPYRKANVVGTLYSLSIRPDCNPKGGLRPLLPPHPIRRHRVSHRPQEHEGDLDDPDFNNVHVNIIWQHERNRLPWLALARMAGEDKIFNVTLTLSDLSHPEVVTSAQLDDCSLRIASL